MKRTLRISAALGVAVVLWVTVAIGVAGADDYAVVRPGGRAGNWEFILPLIYSDSTNVNGSNGSSAHVDADWGFGFGFGYNFTDRLQLNGLWNWGYRSYEATTVTNLGTTRRYSNYMDTSTLSLNGVFYLFDGKITPFITGGIGWTYVDTNIPTAPSGPATCWWDPWYGYVCNNWTPTKTQSDWSYNAGIGVRFDMTRQFSLAASYNKMWIDMNRVSGKPNFDNWMFNFIFRM